MQDMISVKIVADSISNETGIRITTFELEYPRIIHSELMTHRLFSRNAMSSRAIPIKKMIEQVMNNPAMPVRFGANQSGMQDKGLDHNSPVWIGCKPKEFNEEEEIYGTPQQAWQEAAKSAASWAKIFDTAGYHKQIANRLLEPFQRMKTVLTATDFENFWWLRVDKDADPTIFSLAEAMKNAFDNNTPETLKPGQWHTPYVEHMYKFGDGEPDDDFDGYCLLDEHGSPIMLTLEEALAISASCCAQVSYRRLDNTKDKALDIYSKLLRDNKVHASPFEHQATPMKETCDEVDHGEYMVNVDWVVNSWEDGITHVDRQGQFWSGNFCGWIQHRQLVPNNVVSG